MLTYENPIIPGFYPDPSVCRVGEDYYLVNSSFEFFPGVPLWHSRDLLHWEQIGHVLTRDSQLPLENCRTSGGIYAPTIRWRDGRFYMITTNVSNGGNFFVWTDDIRGEWSEPVYIDQGGIDPSLFWDDDGTVYYTGTHSDESGRPGIGMFPVDLETGKRLGETKIIWYGTGGKCPEGPHLYKINGWYYLMIAEGGTEYGHMETIARSRSVWGPYESCPHNPIVTHRNAHREVEFHAVGHADLVEAPDGKWWMVCHAIRPSIFMLHHTGRETMLLPVEWDENGWPVVNGNRYITAEMQVEGEGCVRVPRSWRDDFTDRAPAPRWAYLRNPDRSRYAFGDGLTLRGSTATLDDIGARRSSACGSSSLRCGMRRACSFPARKLLRPASRSSTRTSTTTSCWRIRRKTALPCSCVAVRSICRRSRSRSFSRIRIRLCSASRRSGRNTRFWPGRTRRICRSSAPAARSSFRPSA